jgi:hypothetical protein
MALFFLERVNFPQSLTTYYGATGDLKHLWVTLLRRTAAA